MQWEDYVSYKSIVLVDNLNLLASSVYTKCSFNSQLQVWQVGSVSARKHIIMLFVNYY